MLTQWHEFLTTQGAQWDTETLPQFPPVTDTLDQHLIDLSPYGILSVHGADAESYLQGQLTNDLRELSATHSHLSSHCTHKGRILAAFRILRWPDEHSFQLLMPAELLPGLQEQLRKFVLRSQVTLEIAPDLVPIGLAGPHAARLLRDAGCPVPEHDDDLAATPALAVLRVAASAPAERFLLIGSAAEIMRLWPLLATQARPGNANLWRAFDIQAAVPSVHAATRELFVPQMLNLDCIDGVSFNKGCYVGQEVIARLQHLGKSKRRMFRAEVASPQPPAPGTPLFSAASTSQQGSGWVVDAVATRPGHCELLAVVERALVGSEPVHLGEQGPDLAFLPLPYELPPEE